MELPSIIYPPNKVLERALKPSQFPLLYDYLLFLDINEKEEVVTGSTNLSDCYWESTVMQYKNINDALCLEKYNGYYITSSVSDARFLPNSELIALASDNGHLKLLNTSLNDNASLKCEDIHSSTHSIKQLAVWNHDSKLLACGDNAISTLDVESNCFLNLTRIYKDYHLDAVTSIDTNKRSNGLFASASLDRKVCVWDDRLEPVAAVIYENEFCHVKSVSWNTCNAQHISVGTASGDVYLLDIRHTNEPLDSFHCFDASVHRIRYSACGNLAVAGNTCKVIVLGASFKPIYESNKHTGFVRDLVWSGDSLYTCGFDKQLLQHSF